MNQIIKDLIHMITIMSENGADVSKDDLYTLAKIVSEQVQKHCDAARTHSDSGVLRDYLSEINELPGKVENCIEEYEAIMEIVRMTEPPLCYEMVRSNITKSGYKFV